MTAPQSPYFVYGKFGRIPITVYTCIMYTYFTNYNFFKIILPPPPPKKKKINASPHRFWSRPMTGNQRMSSFFSLTTLTNINVDQHYYWPFSRPGRIVKTKSYSINHQKLFVNNKRVFERRHGQLVKDFYQIETWVVNKNMRVFDDWYRLSEFVQDTHSSLKLN